MRGRVAKLKSAIHANTGRPEAFASIVRFLNYTLYRVIHISHGFKHETEFNSSTFRLSEDPLRPHSSMRQANPTQTKQQQNI